MRGNVKALAPKELLLLHNGTFFDSILPAWCVIGSSQVSWQIHCDCRWGLFFALRYKTGVSLGVQSAVHLRGWQKKTPNIRACKISLKAHLLQIKWFATTLELHDHGCLITKCVFVCTCTHMLGWRRYSSCWVWNSCWSVMVCANGVRALAVKT